MLFTVMSSVMRDNRLLSIPWRQNVLWILSDHVSRRIVVCHSDPRSVFRLGESDSHIPGISPDELCKVTQKFSTVTATLKTRCSSYSRFYFRCFYCKWSSFVTHCPILVLMFAFVLLTLKPNYASSPRQAWSETFLAGVCNMMYNNTAKDKRVRRTTTQYHWNLLLHPQRSLEDGFLYSSATIFQKVLTIMKTNLREVRA